MGINLNHLKNHVRSASVGEAGGPYQQQMFNMIKDELVA